MKKIKIAQIGYGHDHATGALGTAKLLSNIYEVVGIAPVEEDKFNLKRFASLENDTYKDVKKMTVEEVLNYPDLDAVFIETEDRALTKYALMAAKKGLHIHMDKPGGIDQAEFDELIDTVKAKNLVFHTGYMYRYNPAIIQLKENIKNGKLGEIISVEAQMNCYHSLDKRDWLGNYPGGMLYFLGCHMVDLVYSIMGEPEEIIPLNCSSGIDGTKSEDFGMAVFKYKRGMSIAKSTAIEVGGFNRRQLVVIGTKGTVELCPIERFTEAKEGVLSMLTTGIKERFDSQNWDDNGRYHEIEPVGRYDAMIRAFASYVRKEKENPFDYEYERTLHKVILKACGKEV